MILDKYFKHPVVFDYILSVSIAGSVYYFIDQKLIALPARDAVLSTTTDTSTVALTLAGFVLTLLTVLITFKTGAKVPNTQNQSDIPLFDIFFATPLYFETTVLLRNAIKSLVFIAVLGFALKLLLKPLSYQFLFYQNIVCLTIIVTSLWRNLLILGKIIDLQKKD